MFPQWLYQDLSNALCLSCTQKDNSEHLTPTGTSLKVSWRSSQFKDPEYAIYAGWRVLVLPLYSEWPSDTTDISVILKHLSESDGWKDLCLWCEHSRKNNVHSRCWAEVLCVCVGVCEKYREKTDPVLLVTRGRAIRLVWRQTGNTWLYQKLFEFTSLEWCARIIAKDLWADVPLHWHDG